MTPTPDPIESVSVSSAHKENAMMLDELLAKVREEHERQAAHGMTAEHDRIHGEQEWAALLAKQAGDVSMAAAGWTFTGGGSALATYEEAVIQSLAVGFAALGVRLDS